MIYRYLRRYLRDVTDGLSNARDMLLWGQVYPRRLDLRDIWRP